MGLTVTPAGGGSVNTSSPNTWTGAQGFTASEYRNFTTMGSTAIDVTKAASRRALSASEQESFSATPSTDMQLLVEYTADSTARTVTFATTVYSFARQGDIASLGFIVPASGTVLVMFIYNLTATRWEITGDPLPSASVFLTEASNATTIDASKGSVFSLTLSANLNTVTLSNFNDGNVIIVSMTNTASNYTVTWGNSIKWSGGSQPVQTVGAKTDVWTLAKIGTLIFGSVVQNMS